METITIQAPVYEYKHIELPRTTLEYVQTGDGPPMIMVPATVSLLSQWLPLAQFMGQKFNVHFFSMPGHGGSTPYPMKFNSDYIPETIEAMADKLGFERFNLMGFSFGGLLTMKTIEHLQDRIDTVILIAPYVSSKALKYSGARRAVFDMISRLLVRDDFQEFAIKMMRSETAKPFLIRLMSAVGDVDRKILEGKDALNLPASTLDVFAYTLREILTQDWRPTTVPFPMHCYFGMSIYDNLLDYETTLDITKGLFKSLTVQEFYYPYHQPPEPPTFESLVADYQQFLDKIEV